jgi:hypothetical protein
LGTSTCAVCAYFLQLRLRRLGPQTAAVVAAPGGGLAAAPGGPAQCARHVARVGQSWATTACAPTLRRRANRRGVFGARRRSVFYSRLTRPVRYANNEAACVKPMRRPQWRDDALGRLRQCASSDHLVPRSLVQNDSATLGSIRRVGLPSWRCPSRTTSDRSPNTSRSAAAIRPALSSCIRLADIASHPRTPHAKRVGVRFSLPAAELHPLLCLRVSCAL